VDVVDSRADKADRVELQPAEAAADPIKERRADLAVVRKVQSFGNSCRINLCSL
jgi:hypothetical protein